ncbi:hypothetical protein [Falsiroseomonas sp.]|uniref:hypothetical protein n=1 Tax=Falsiroseomonas sp. TaxID=2870721 RepID=UPI00356B0C6C
MSAILAALLLAVSAPAILRAQGLDASALFEAFARQPGARMEETTTPQGLVTSVEANGVRMSRMGEGDSTSFVEQDVSGKGAVLCAWGLTGIFSVLLDACRPDDAAEAREDTAHALRDMLAFILANDLARRPRSFWESQLETQRAQARQFTSEQVHRICRREQNRQILNAYINTPSDERRRRIAELLSVPRQPVVNPCL